MGKIVPKAERQMQELRNMRTSLYNKCIRVLDTVPDAADYDDEPDMESHTPEEIERYGSVAAVKRAKRIIRDVRKTKANEPAYISHTREMAKNLEKVEAAELLRGSGHVTNINVFMMDEQNTPQIQDAEYDVLDVSVSDDE